MIRYVTLLVMVSSDGWAATQASTPDGVYFAVLATACLVTMMFVSQTGLAKLWQLSSPRIDGLFVRTEFSLRYENLRTPNQHPRHGYIRAMSANEIHLIVEQPVTSRQEIEIDLGSVNGFPFPDETMQAFVKKCRPYGRSGRFFRIVLRLHDLQDVQRQGIDLFLRSLRPSHA